MTTQYKLLPCLFYGTDMEKEIGELERLYADTLAKRTKELDRILEPSEEIVYRKVDKQDLFKALAK